MKYDTCYHMDEPWKHVKWEKWTQKATYYMFPLRNVQNRQIHREKARWNENWLLMDTRFLFFKVYLFIWLPPVSVAACGNLTPQLGIKSSSPALHGRFLITGPPEISFHSDEIVLKFQWWWMHTLVNILKNTKLYTLQWINLCHVKSTKF